MSDEKVIVAEFDVVILTKALGMLAKYRNKKYKLAFSGFKVYIPITTINDNVVRIVERLGGVIKYMSSEIIPKRVNPVSLKELERKHNIILPKSVNILGDILTINDAPRMNENYLENMGEILMRNFGVRAVFVKEQKISGITRVAKWRRVAGWGDTFTVHRENNCYFAVDIAKVFFNPRLGTERLRIVNIAREKEIVLDMFAGVGPFAIQLAKLKKARAIAIDINKSAIELLKLNAQLNKVSVVAYEGDAREVVLNEGIIAERIIMNYPERAIEFLDVAISAINRSGWIHLYVFGKSSLEFKQEIESIGRNVGAIIEVRNIRYVNEVAPRRYTICYDLFINK